MTDTTPAALERIVERLREILPKVTPGPWMVGHRSDGSMWLSIGDPVNGPHHQGDLCASEADAELIVEAPNMAAGLGPKPTGVIVCGEHHVRNGKP